MSPRSTSFSWASVLALVLALAVAGQAVADIPTTSWLMNRLADKRAKQGVRRLKVDLLCGQGEAGRKKEVLYLKAPKLVRHERADGSVLICREGHCRALSDGQSARVQPDWVYLKYFYFVEPSLTGERFVRLLRALKVDKKVNTLARKGSRVAVVLGAKEWELDRPQFWLDKDRFLPLRLMTRNDKNLVDIQWQDWGSRVSGDWFPAKFEIRIDGRLIDSCSTVDVEVNASMPDELFKAS